MFGTIHSPVGNKPIPCNQTTQFRTLISPRNNLYLAKFTNDFGRRQTAMAKKKELLSKAPWRGDDDDSDKFSGAKLKVTKESDGMSKMHVPSRGTNKGSLADDEDSLEIDPQLRYSFNRNYQFLQRVFSIDTVVKPLPPAMAYNVSRNLSFFTRIFTQFFDPEGIANAQKSLGLGQEDKARRVR